MPNKEYTGPHLLSPAPIVLLTSGTKEKGNVATVAWSGVLTGSEVFVALRPSRYSYELIEQSGEFALNIPTADMIEAVDKCGVTSGRDMDKFKENGFTKFYCDEIKAPLIEECYLNVACKVEESIRLGVHTMFVGKVVKKFMTDPAPKESEVIAYVGPHYYKIKPEELYLFGRSIEEGV